MTLGRRARGFSLVEIAMALGIFSFCLIALLGLFSASLKTQQESEDEEASASLLAGLALALENATPSTNGLHVCGPPLDGWTWDARDGSASTHGLSDGFAYWVRIGVVNTDGDSRLASARMEVAWPGAAVTWTPDGQPLNARGGAGSTAFLFLR